MKVKFKKKDINVETEDTKKQLLTGVAFLTLSFLLIHIGTMGNLENTLVSETTKVFELNNENVSSETEIMTDNTTKKFVVPMSDDMLPDSLEGPSLDPIQAEVVKETLSHLPNENDVVYGNRIDPFDPISAIPVDNERVSYTYYDATQDDHSIVWNNNQSDVMLMSMTSGPHIAAAANMIEAEEDAMPEAVEEERRASRQLFLNLDQHELDIFYRIVEAEVTGVGRDLGTSDSEAYKSKFRVARVIINRVLDARWPNTIEGVVFQKGQFSPISDRRYYKVAICDLTIQACQDALDMSLPDDIHGAQFFQMGHWNSKKIYEVLRDPIGVGYYAYR